MTNYISKVTTNIIINTSFIAIHAWPDCGIPGVTYLKNPHRHTFNIRVTIPVDHDDRDIEFINFKKEMDDYFNQFNNKDIGAKSCEMICQDILNKWPDITYVRVMEDNECGSEKIRRYLQGTIRML